ncbi:hypothetical protein SmJEL517_g02551 [Synchytrium microbalum]|uniref:SNARE-complex protein Syntaxin-18 N-terminal domain-containing protein n=1 Tax=Synchytrium microbalum TaxID=1806994 RepID=A0A507CA17_9FUNG|nr:uncharacterized protein SmJEL517_g02551 [Synchytrium microbalum]TPX34824.1 hypothetical protein SmJEL517_g02551 [Synchytrium microbalum]
MDITTHFFNVLSTHEALTAKSKAASSSYGLQPTNNSSHILRRNHHVLPKDDFSRTAIDILLDMGHLRDFLLASRRSYLGLPQSHGLEHSIRESNHGAFFTKKSPFPATTPTHLTDKGRDELEGVAHSFVSACIRRIESLQRLAEVLHSKEKGLLHTNNSIGLKEHRDSIIWMLQHRLAQTSQILKAMQEKRVQTALQKREGLLFHTSSSESKSADTLNGKSPHPQPSPLLSNSTHTNAFGFSISSVTSAAVSSLSLATSKINNNSASTVNSTSTPPQSLDYMDGSNSDPAASMPEEQRMLLEAENERVLAELEGQTDQVRLATQSLREISELQNMLGRHLAVQQETISTIHSEAIQATQDMQDANKVLVSAKKTMGSARLWVIVFLLMASFCLLFLDWFYS